MDNSCCHPLKTRQPRPRKSGTPARQIVRPWPVAPARSVMLKMSPDAPAKGTLRDLSRFVAPPPPKLRPLGGRTRFVLDGPNRHAAASGQRLVNPRDATSRTERLPTRRDAPRRKPSTGQGCAQVNLPGQLPWPAGAGMTFKKRTCARLVTQPALRMPQGRAERGYSATIAVVLVHAHH